MKTTYQSKDWAVRYNEDTTTFSPLQLSETNFYQDQKLAGEILRVIKHEYISVASKNIEVIVENGFITLKGEVFVDEEKIRIGQTVCAYVGYGRVFNQLDVLEEME